MPAHQRAVQLVRHSLTMRLLEVRCVGRLSPRMVRITLGGSDLDGFRSLAADDHVKLFFPADGHDRPVLPAVDPGGLVYPEDAPRPAHRDYTPRRYRPVEQELDVDMVLHGAGPGSAWASRAEPGMAVGVAGPRGSFVIPDSFDWYLLAGDETALPAIGRRLGELPSAARALVLIEVDGADDELRLETRADVRLTWLHRDGAAPGTSDSLLRAVRSLVLPDGDGFAWAAGEASAMHMLRQHLRNERGLDSNAMKVRGYWKRGIEDHQEPHDD